MTQPLISIIMPTYSRFEGGFLERCIQSVRNQTYSQWELLIMDDGSMDGSEQLIQQFCSLDQRIKHFRQKKNIGLPAYTTALGYLEAKGDYIAFAFDDTVLYPNHLLILLDTLLRNPNAGLAYGQCSMIVSDQSRVTLGNQCELEQMLRGHNQIPNGAVMIPRTIVENVGWYDPHILLKRTCDWDLWVRIMRKYPVKFIPQVLVEEHGVNLKGSLGNSVMLNSPLLLKYVQQYRDPLLQPELLHKYNVFRLDFSDRISQEDIRGVRELELDHYMKTLNMEELIRYAERLRAEAPNDYIWEMIENQNKNISDKRLQLLLYACQKSMDNKNEYHFKENQSIKQLIVDKDNYITQKQAYVEEQWALLHQKDGYIQHQSSLIQQKDQYIAEQHRLILYLQSLLQ